MSAKNIEKDYDHKKEKLWCERWQDDEIFKYIGDGTRPRYIIDTPPPYPTGKLHLGHVLNWVYMDMDARFRRLTPSDAESRIFTGLESRIYNNDSRI